MTTDVRVLEVWCGVLLLCTLCGRVANSALLADTRTFFIIVLSMCTVPFVGEVSVSRVRGSWGFLIMLLRKKRPSSRNCA